MQNNKVLIFVLIFLVIVSYFVIQNQDKTTVLTSSEKYLIPELQDKINDVREIVISKNAQTISLKKQDDIWRIAESDNYLADANKIATLLLELRKFKLKQKKTSNVDNYAKLELAENNTTKIVLKNVDKQFADIFIGKTAQRGAGTYVRINNDKQTWLATGTANIQLDSKDWIVTTILDIEGNTIKSVSYTPADSAAFTIDKATPKDSNFVIKDMPANMQQKAGVELNSLANGLQKFNIESAVAKVELPAASKTMTVNYQLFSGMSYQLDLYKQDDKHLLNIAIANADSDSSFAKQLENWQFTIPKFKSDALHKKLADLIEKTSAPIDEATKGTEKKD